MNCNKSSDGPGQFIVAQVGSGQVSHLWFGYDNFLNFFPWGQKNLFGLGQKVPGSKDGLLFTVGQK